MVSVKLLKPGHILCFTSKMVESVHQRTPLRTVSDLHQQLGSEVSCRDPFAVVPASPKTRLAHILNCSIFSNCLVFKLHF